MNTEATKNLTLDDIVAAMKVLSLSDKTLDLVYNPSAKERFGDVDLVLGCGDLPYYYLEYLVDQLNVPVFFVRGNHDPEIEYAEHGERRAPWGAVDLHQRVVHQDGVLLAGFEGCVLYRRGPFMYTQGQMWWKVFAMLPRLLWNLLRHGRMLDVLISHAPPRGLGDRPDWAHNGFAAFRFLLWLARPAYHFHGHIHLDDRNAERRIQYMHTTIVNTYGYLESDIAIGKG